MVNIVPVDVSEEWLAHDFLGIGWSASKSLIRLSGQQLLEDRDGISRHVNWVERLVGKNGVVDFVFVFTAERRLLEKHLVDEDTKGPPIDSSAVFFVEQNL